MNLKISRPQTDLFQLFYQEFETLSNEPTIGFAFLNWNQREIIERIEKIKVFSNNNK